MKKILIALFMCMLVIPAGCGKKVIHSTPPARNMPVVKNDSPEVAKPVLKTDPYTVGGVTYYPFKTSKGYEAQGLASWYGDDFHGKTTANGETYDMYAMTAAHRRLPMGTMVEVTDLSTGKRVVVRINDRGPFADTSQRIIDLSYKAASKLGIVNKGLTRVALRSVNDVTTKPVKASEIAVDTAAPIEETSLSDVSDSNTAKELVSQTAVLRDIYYVQVGAFSNEEGANAVLDTLKARGYEESRIEKVMINGTEFMRVQAGAFDSIEKAEKAMDELSAEYPRMFIVDK